MSVKSDTTAENRAQAARIAELESLLAKHQESQFHPDWSLLEATRESLREALARIAELEAKPTTAERGIMNEPKREIPQTTGREAMKEIPVETGARSICDICWTSAFEPCEPSEKWPEGLACVTCEQRERIAELSKMVVERNDDVRIQWRESAGGE